MAKVPSLPQLVELTPAVVGVNTGTRSSTGAARLAGDDVIVRGASDGPIRDPQPNARDLPGGLRGPLPATGSALAPRQVQRAARQGQPDEAREESPLGRTTGIVPSKTSSTTPFSGLAASADRGQGEAAQAKTPTRLTTRDIIESRGQPGSRTA
jgi:hypothetical protein